MATVTSLLERNANVIALARTESPELAALAIKHPGQLYISQTDVTSTQREALDAGLQAYSSLDSIVFNAGILDVARLEDAKLEDIRY